MHYLSQHDALRLSDRINNDVLYCEQLLAHAAGVATRMLFSPVDPHDVKEIAGQAVLQLQQVLAKSKQLSTDGPGEEFALRTVEKILTKIATDRVIDSNRRRKKWAFTRNLDEQHPAITNAESPYPGPVTIAIANESWALGLRRLSFLEGALQQLQETDPAGAEGAAIFLMHVHLRLTFASISSIIQTAQSQGTRFEDLAAVVRHHAPPAPTVEGLVALIRRCGPPPATIDDLEAAVRSLAPPAPTAETGEEIETSVPSTYSPATAHRKYLSACERLAPIIKELVARACGGMG